MTELRLFAMAAVAFFSFAPSSLADTPRWMGVQQPSDITSPSPIAEHPGSHEQSRLSPDSIFSGSPESLIRVSCSTAECGCEDGLETFAPPSCSQTWVQFTPYAWATQMQGDLTVDGITAPVNIDLSDLWKLLENGQVRGGFMGHLEAGRDNWSMFVNGDIVSMAPSAQVRRANIDAGLTMTLLELGGAIDLFNANESDPVNSPLRVQMLGGVRYNAVDASTILSLPNINPVVDISSSEQWVDLFVGGRVVAQLTPGMKGFVRGDAGGFGIGTSSNHAWNLVSGITTDCI